MGDKKLSEEFKRCEEEIDSAQLSKELSCKLIEILLCHEFESTAQIINNLRIDYSKAILEENWTEVELISKEIGCHLAKHPAFYGRILTEEELQQKSLDCLKLLEITLKETAVASIQNMELLPRVIACTSLRKKLLVMRKKYTTPETAAVVSNDGSSSVADKSTTSVDQEEVFDGPSSKKLKYGHLL